LYGGLGGIDSSLRDDHCVRYLFVICCVRYLFGIVVASTGRIDFICCCKPIFGCSQCIFSGLQRGGGHGACVRLRVDTRGLYGGLGGIDSSLRDDHCVRCLFVICCVRYPFVICCVRYLFVICYGKPVPAVVRVALVVTIVIPIIVVGMRREAIRCEAFGVVPSMHRTLDMLQIKIVDGKASLSHPRRKIVGEAFFVPAQSLKFVEILLVIIVEIVVEFVVHVEILKVLPPELRSERHCLGQFDNLNTTARNRLACRFEGGAPNLAIVIKVVVVIIPVVHV